MGRVVKALVAVFAAIVLGLFAIFALAKYRLEHARFTERFAIITDAPGFSVSTAESGIAAPLEQALGGLQGLESMRTVIHPGRVEITVEVTAIGMNASPPLEVVHGALKESVRYLPTDVLPPYVTRLDAETRKVRFLARSETMTRLELTQWLDQVFRELEVQPGVRELSLCGGVTPELKITLDQARLAAMGLPATEVLRALRSAERGSLEALQDLELGRGVRLRDLAQLELATEAGACTSARDVLVTVQVLPGTALQLPAAQRDATLTPFAPKRTAIFLSPAGSSVREAMEALARRYQGAVVTAKRDELMVLFPEEPTQLNDVPGLAVRSLDDRHSVLQVSGPDFDELVALSEKASELLSKQHPRWLGVSWPGLAPEKVMQAEREVPGLAELLRLVVGGVSTGRLQDGADVRVVIGSSLEELLLADGRRATDLLQITNTLGPAAMLRVNGLRTVEVEVGMEAAEVRRVVDALQLPPGYSVRVVERGG